MIIRSMLVVVYAVLLATSAVAHEGSVKVTHTRNELSCAFPVSVLLSECHTYPAFLTADGSIQRIADSRVRMWIALSSWEDLRYVRLGLRQVRPAYNKPLKLQWNAFTLTAQYLGIQRGVGILQFELHWDSALVAKRNRDTIHVVVGFDREPVSQHTAWSGALPTVNHVHWGDKALRTPSVASTASFPIAYMYTKRDGIALLPLANLLELAPQLSGLPSEPLRIIRRGHAVPYALIDSDDKLTNDDTLYFLGSRAEGDTTFLNAYTDEAAFEVWYDRSLPLKRLAQIRDSVPSAPIRNHLYIERHLEEEHEYVQGWIDTTKHNQFVSTFVTETVEGEQWAWMITYSVRPFGMLLWCAPDPDSTNGVALELHYSAINDDIYSHFDQQHRLIYAGTSRDSAAFDGPRYNVLRTTIVPNRDGSIVDSVMFVSHGSSVAAQAIDFITTQGTEKAVAWKNQLSGTCAVRQPEKLNAVNFLSSQVVVFDTIANVWARLEGSQGVLFRLGARRAPTWRASIAIGDTVTFVTQPIHLVAWIDRNGRFQRYTSSNPSNVAGLIAALQQGTPYAVAINNTSLVDSQLRHVLEQEGSRIAQELDSDAVYLAVGVRGEPLFFRERSNADASALLEWVQTSIGVAYGVAYNVQLPLSEGEHGIILTGIDSVERARLLPMSGAELLNDTNQADYLIITHQNFRSAAETLAEFRRRRNSVRARIIDIRDVYNVFGQGEKSPHAIKNFLRYAYQQWGKPTPTAVLLLGDASWDPRRVSRDATSRDFVPTYGKPVSDFWYALLEGDDLLPELSVGRIPVQTLEQAEIVVRKIIEHDTASWEQWNKRFLFITGGATLSEQHDFYQSVIYTLTPLLVEENQRALCADTITVSLYLDANTTNPPLPAKIVSVINAGVGWVNYIGHGSPTTMEISGWEPSRLTNDGRYPILASFSCQIGAFAEPSVTALGEDYLSRDHGGMVAVVATTGFGIRSYDDFVNAGIFATVARTRTRTIGAILDKAKFFVYDGSQLAINTIMQTNLLGDPLTRFPIDSLPSPVLDRRSVTFRSIPYGSALSSTADSVVVSATVFNAGIYADSTIRIVTERFFGALVDTAEAYISGLCRPQQIEIRFPIKNMAGEHRLRFHLDPDNRLGRGGEIVEIPMYVFGQQLYAIEPQSGWNVAISDTTIRFLNPIANRQKFSYEGYLFSQHGDTVLTSAGVPFVELPTHIEWRIPRGVLQSSSEYRYYIQATDLVTGARTPWLEVPFVVTKTASPDTIEHRQGDEGNWQRSTTIGMMTTDSGLITQAQLPLELLSAGGYQYYDRDTLRIIMQPAYQLRVIQQPITTESNNEYGVHVAVISSQDSTIKAVRWYATSTSISIPRSDGNTQALLTFLRDSVDSDDWLVIVSCGNAWGGNFRQYADQFRALLQEYGARLTDSLQGSRSYVFIGMRSSSRPLVIERLGTDSSVKGGDTVHVAVQLPLFPPESNLILPVAGPASAWYDATLVDHCNAKRIRLIILGGLSPEQITTTLLVSDSTSLMLDNIDAARYPYIRVVAQIARDSGDWKPCAIEKAIVRYKPKAEYTLTINPSNVFPMRGDTVTTQLVVYNLVSRCSTRTVRVHWSVRDENGRILVGNATGDTLVSVQQLWQEQISVPTYFLPSSAFLDASMTSIDSTDELYTFNNDVRGLLAIREDQEPPYIAATIQGQLRGDTTVVPRVVTISCALLDSARIAVEDSTSLVLRLNGVRLPVLGQAYRFYTMEALGQHPFWSNYNLARAAVDATLALEQGTNILIVTARDRAGNTATRHFVLYVPDALNLERVSIIPQPVITDDAVFSIAYQGFEQSVSATIEVYDGMGRRVLTQHAVLQNGINQVRVPMRSDIGHELLQSGMYYWRVWLGALSPQEAKSGVMVLVR